MTQIFHRSKVSCQLTPWGEAYRTGLKELAALDVTYVEIGSRLLLPFEREINRWRELLNETGHSVSGVFEFGHFAGWNRRREIYLHHDRLARMLESAGIGRVILGPGIRLKRSWTEEDRHRMMAMVTEIHKRYSFYGVAADIHPHISHCIYTREEIDYVMERAPDDLGLVPDVGHLHEAGIAMRDLLERYGPRITALHVKDARPAEGDPRSARPGSRKTVFTELGSGMLDLSSLLQDLAGHDFSGFLTLEMDEVSCPPGEAVRLSLDVLKNQSSKFSQERKKIDGHVD
ncbi:sugar phosphate isomerase/epimerase family protein [Paenibacillus chitinolyticus]|uniref:sugar phosphate isomerase/epimerase family protein n=1 Tax=Paenibacillus chitinolyticus TaxID=79263 RepID=UPI001C463AF4|nr:sugar phosphate isomerase/epimerase [Paenibacillus chitinolyticus]MBV6713650.1 sugar phosphate isomerase/epimerase [Paenibacillus chitinolyticus]